MGVKLLQIAFCQCFFFYKFMKRHGFTLVEILITIGILGLLAAIVILAINPKKQLEAAQEVKRKFYARELRNAVLQFAIDNKGIDPGDKPLPQSQDQAMPICRAGAADTHDCIVLDALVAAKYIVQLPADPSEPDPDWSGYVIYRDGPQVLVTPAPQPAREIAMAPVADFLNLVGHEIDGLALNSQITEFTWSNNGNAWSLGDDWHDDPNATNAGYPGVSTWVELGGNREPLSITVTVAQAASVSYWDHVADWEDSHGTTLSFSVDGTLIHTTFASDNQGWTLRGPFAISEGSHTLSWQAAVDEEPNQGYASIDDVQFPDLLLHLN